MLPVTRIFRGIYDRHVSSHDGIRHYTFFHHRATRKHLWFEHKVHKKVSFAEDNKTSYGSSKASSSGPSSTSKTPATTQLIVNTKLENKPKKFYDGSRSQKKLIRFEEAWRKCLHLSTWSSDRDQVRRFGGFLTRDALSWWLKMDPSDKAALTNGEDCLRVLRQEFDIGNRKNIYETLLREKRHRGEDNLYFIRRLLRTISNKELAGATPLTDMEERNAVESVVKKLENDGIATNLLRVECLEDARRYITLKFSRVKDLLLSQAKANFSEGDSSSGNSSSDDDSSSSSDEEYRQGKKSKLRRRKNCKKTSAIIAALENLTSTIKSPIVSCYICGGPHKKIDCPKYDGSKEVVCTGRKRPGHVLDRCFRFGNLCERCKSRGHKTEDCKAPTCRRCPGHYHFFKNCPILRQEEQAEIQSQKN